MKYEEEKAAASTMKTFPERFIPGHSIDWVVELGSESNNGVPYCGEFQNGMFEHAYLMDKEMSSPRPIAVSSVEEERSEDPVLSGISTASSTPSLGSTDNPSMPPFLGMEGTEYFSALGSGEVEVIQNTQEAHPCVVELHPVAAGVDELPASAVDTETLTPIIQVPEKYFNVPQNVPLTLEEAELHKVTTGATSEVMAAVPVEEEGAEEDSNPPTAEPELKKPKRNRKPKAKPEPQGKEYVTVRDQDVLFGRGGRSNHHDGNRIYRTEIENYKPHYMALQDKNQKTLLSNQIVDFIQNGLGGRFLAKDDSYQVEMWYVVDRKFARRKVAQALRENNTPEARAEKKAKYPKKKKK